MPTWLIDDPTGACEDYVHEGTFLPRLGKAIRVSDVSLSPGEDPRTYRWNGSAIIKRPVVERNPKRDGMQRLKAAIDNETGWTNVQKTILKRILDLFDWGDE